ncbi:MAG TPA: hypothetical protein VLY63_17620 [Anaerolineae bacterium]|nr:hypothetical protein [Anaerolineae bacterium]
MLARVKSLAARSWLRDLAALALLAGLALAACSFLLRDDLFIYGDHPGQFMRLWYPLRVSHRLLGWNPSWYAGYPELQFYPPGFALLGWGLDWLTLRNLSPYAVYQFLLFVSYLLPGMTVYALVSRVSGRRWAGLVSGVLALVFPELWGGANAVFVGLVAERLAFGLVPLVMFTGWQALHARHPTRWWLLASLAVAATVLMHPFHAVAPVLFLAIAALFYPNRWSLFRNLALTGVLSLALVAFWLLPLLFHSGYAAPMLRADMNQTLDWLLSPTARMYLIASLLVPLALLVEQKRGLTIFVVSAFIMAVTLVAFMIFDHVVLIDMLGFYLLDPVRFIAEVYLVLVLFAGLGLAYLPLWLSREGRAQVGMLVGGLAMVLALVWMGRPFLDLVRSHRDGNQFLAQARQSFPLDETWQALQSGEGRILFSSYYLHLGEVPTALKSATPFFTGRNIIGGTFSHWSPVARVLWTGSTDAQLLPGQVELTDDISLAGRAWIDWTDGEMYKLCQQLNVTTVATTWDDINARTFLDAAPHFQSFYSNDLFVLYRVLDPEPGLIAADGATTAVIHAGPTALDLHVTGATTNASLQIGITDYPLWRVQAGDQKIPHHADGLGLMSVPIPPGSYDLTLRYLPGPAEWVGTLLSLAATVVWLSLGVYSLLPGARRLSTEA